MDAVVLDMIATPSTPGRRVLRPTHADDLVAALTAFDPGELSAAFSRAGGTAISRVADAVISAATHLAYYPTEDVVAEADALLYDVLTWPITDTNPDFPDCVDVRRFAAARGIPVADARRVLDHLSATENAAVEELLASGVEPNYTREQAQVLDCIQALVASGATPTRARVREHATVTARASLRRGEGDQPLIYPTDRRLGARVISTSPKIHAIIWLDRLSARRHVPGILSQRIDFLSRARVGASQASVIGDHLARVRRDVSGGLEPPWPKQPASMPALPLGSHGWSTACQ